MNSFNSGTKKAILFDLDGVIADSRRVHEIAWTALLREHGRKPSKPELRFIEEGRKRSEMVAHLFPQANPQEQEVIGLRKDELYYANVHHLRPVPGATELVRKLAGFGIPLALATCAGRARALSTLRQFGLETMFRVIVTGSEVALGKPGPGIFLKAAELLGYAPCECLVIEDSLSGLTAAQAAGMACYLFSPADCDQRLRELQPDRVIHDFTSAELAHLLTTVCIEEAIHG